MDIQSVGAVAIPAQPARDSREAPLAVEFSKTQPQPASPTKEEVREAVKEIQQNTGSNSTNLQFSVDEASGKTIVSVIDSETRQVVRQIPSEEIMRMARAMDRMQGLLFNGKA